MSRPPETPAAALERGFRHGYCLGLALCVVLPLALQLALGPALRAAEPWPADLALELGYTFTGLTCAAALFVHWRSARARRALAGIPPALRGAAVRRELLLYAATLECAALFGLLTYAMGGPHATRYARGFLGLTPVMFFIFVPGLRTWRVAANAE